MMERTVAGGPHFCDDTHKTLSGDHVVINPDPVITAFVDHKGIIPVSGIFGDYPCGNLGIVGIFLIKIVKFLQACELCLVWIRMLFCSVRLLI